MLGEVLKNFEDASDEIAKLQKILRYLLNGNLDYENVRVKGLTAETIDVNELSAINANLGHITAGLIESVEIFGSYIATKNGTYPRAEMSDTNDLFGAYKDALNYIEIDSNFSGSPVMNVVEGGTVRGQISSLSNKMRISGTGDMDVNASGDVVVTPGLSNFLRVSTFSKIFGTSEGKNLGTALGEKVNTTTAFASYAVNMSFDPATRNLKLFAGNGATLATVNIP